MPARPGASVYQLICKQSRALPAAATSIQQALAEAEVLKCRHATFLKRNYDF
jgi:hypothetical protein